MAEVERKSLVWSIKKCLLNLPANKLFQIAMSLVRVPGMGDLCPLHPDIEDEESCFNYIDQYMHSEHLLELEDAGMAYLLDLKDAVNKMSDPEMHVLDAVPRDSLWKSLVDVDANENLPHNVPAIDSEQDVPVVATYTTKDDTIGDKQTGELQKMFSIYEELSKQVKRLSQSVHQAPPRIQSTPPDGDAFDPKALSEQATSVAPDKMISLRELSYLHRREFKIQGGQIGDQGSDISYNSVCRQIDEGLKKQFSDVEIVRAVLRVIKPGHFKDMLMNKDDLTVKELKGFLHSHLGEQSNTELFQELMCTKQKDGEMPQQFLYRAIGLKQKILLVSKHDSTDVKYNVSTVQDVFLHTVYQGLGHKHDDIRRELKPLLADPKITDDVILKHMKKIMSDESERQQRLGPSNRHRQKNVHSAQVEVDLVQSPGARDESSGKKSKTDVIQQLTDKVEKLTSLVESMQQLINNQNSEQGDCTAHAKTHKKRGKPYGCAKCVEHDCPDCTHCFHCGEEGHRAVGCLKKPKHQGNWSRSLSGDKQ